MEYDIYHKWKHREGHFVEVQINIKPIVSENETEAILNFKEQKIEGVGKFIFQNEDNSFRYGSYFGFGEYNPIYAIKL